MKLAICRVPVGAEGARAARTQDLGSWWVQFGDLVLLYAANKKWGDVTGRAESEGLRLEEYPGEVRKGDMYLVVQKGRLLQQEYPDVPVLLDKGRYLVVELSAEEAKKIGRRKEPSFVVEPLRENTVVFDVRSPPTARRVPKAWVQNLVNDVDRPGFEASITDLVSYPTRYSTSSHYLDAAVLVRQQLEDLGYTTAVETISADGGSSRNVIADKLGGGSGTRDLVLVVAHLDSINTSGGPAASAPGADDNASGSAGLLEIARVLKDHPLRHDLRFILFGGEEQGMDGSSHYVGSLSAAEQARITTVINMDMIGSLNTSVPTVLLEGASVSQTLIDALSDAAFDYTSLTVQTSLSPYASDHVPFIDADLPAVLTIEGADGANSFIHTAGDTLAHIDFDLALEILRMNVAATATAVGRKGGLAMFDYEAYEFAEFAEAIQLLFGQRSGRYTYNGGVSERSGRSAAGAREGEVSATFANPIYNLDKPTYIEEVNPGLLVEVMKGPRFTLHIDIDGKYPLNVVSGTVARGILYFAAPAHFIGQVTSSSWSAGLQNLVVEGFSFQWPGSASTIDRLEIAITGGYWFVGAPSAEVTFFDTAHGTSRGPYTAARKSKYFREVEVEVDCEDGAVDAEPYNTHTHPDRPADLPEEDLTLEKAYGRAGIKITRSPHGNVINTAEAGANNRWSMQEIHDAMDDHWSAFANIPQWKMWIFLAELANSDGLGGAMFDAYIDEPGGVDRQGTAVFTLSPWFHTVGGGYITANPPEAEAVERELFFNLVHESGHAFNLYHSFSKAADTPWTPPSWMPADWQSDAQTLSWLNYPEMPSPGDNATWFYDRFYFRFHEDEHLFLRHAPARFVKMGGEPFGENHGRVSRGSLDRRLELVVRSLKQIVDLGEPVFVELRLRNVSNESVRVHGNLDPSDGLVELAVTNPCGERRPFAPFMRTRCQVVPQMLEAGRSLYEPANLTMGLFGFPFKEPGPYRIEASYRNTDGGTAAAVMQLWVRPPGNFDDRAVISELFSARVGRVLQVGGSREMQDVNDRLDWVCDHLGQKHPVTYYLSAARAEPLATRFKVLRADTNRLRVLDPDPGFVERRLAPVVADAEAAADSMGHITYHRVVDAYSRSAVQAKKKVAARQAQETMLGVFEKRGVIEPVIQGIEQRVKELK